MAQKERTRALSEYAARTCEEAKHPACRCRCHGTAHGGRGNRGSINDEPTTIPVQELLLDVGDKLAQKYGFEIPKEFYYQLPEDDPHHLYTEEERRELAAKRRAERLARLAPVAQAIEILKEAGYVQSSF